MRVAIYIRVSTLDQAREGYSLAAQRAALERWAAERQPPASGANSAASCGPRACGRYSPGRYISAITPATDSSSAGRTRR